MHLKNEQQLQEILQRPGMQKANPGVAPGLPDPKRKHHERSQIQDLQLEKSPEGVGCCVTIISLRKRRVDAHDNLRTGGKALVDAITRSLGFHSDDNPRLTWEYAQAISDQPGTIVRIAWV